MPDIVGQALPLASSFVAGRRDHGQARAPALQLRGVTKTRAPAGVNRASAETVVHRTPLGADINRSIS
jgi:hypothetical protein